MIEVQWQAMFQGRTIQYKVPILHYKTSYECFMSQMQSHITAVPLSNYPSGLYWVSKRDLRQEFHPISAVRVLRYGYVVDWIIEKCHQLPRRGSILRPLKTRSAIGIQVRGKVD